MTGQWMQWNNLQILLLLFYVVIKFSFIIINIEVKLVWLSIFFQFYYCIIIITSHWGVNKLLASNMLSWNSEPVLHFDRIIRCSRKYPWDLLFWNVCFFFLEGLWRMEQGRAGFILDRDHKGHSCLQGFWWNSSCGENQRFCWSGKKVTAQQRNLTQFHLVASSL